MPSSRNTRLRVLLIGAAVGLLAVALVGTFGPARSHPAPKTTYSELILRVERRPWSVRGVLFEPTSRTIRAILTSGRTVAVHYPSDQSQAAFQTLLQRQQVEFDSAGPSHGSVWTSLLFAFLPLALLVALFAFLMRRARGGNTPLLPFGKSPARMVRPDAPKIRFDAVAGTPEAVEELREVVAFLREPRKFEALGARIPKGVLLYGPPGTGKTLLARAVAGEAGVPFFSISGSDFVEMFVGVGASRVRSLFEQAKRVAPSIVFVDEIDAVGRHRGMGLGGGHDEREQTLNQLLVELDGFELKDKVILIAATNRPDVLDPALLRPGRFDRQITVAPPDRAGRREILAVHAAGKPLSSAVDLDTLAAGTSGFTGADLANLLNEAALLAARAGKRLVGQDELEEGLMRVIAGPEKSTRLLSERERTITAYHEMGHALVGHFLQHTDPVHKITIVSRGQALGLTVSRPTEDRYLTTESELTERMATALAGRAAEELAFHEATTGAANDLEQVTEIAKQMITRFGMSEAIGLRALGRDREQPVAGRSGAAGPEYSEEVARAIDREIARLIELAHEQALTVLGEHLDELHRLSDVLLEHETIDREQFVRLLAGEPADSIFPRPPDAADSEQASGSERVRPRPTLQPRPFPLPG